MPPTFTDLQGGFEIGPWTVIPDRGLLRQGTTEEHLEPMVMDVLMVLAGYQGDVVSRDQLVDAVWDGRFVADEAIVAKIATLRHKLGDDAKNPTYIETVPRRGYRLMLPIVVSDAVLPEDAGNRRIPVYLVSIAVIAVIIIAGVVHYQKNYAPIVDGPVDSVAVLQFMNLSDDKEKFQYIVEGFREELVTSLDQVPNLKITRGPRLSDDRTASMIANELSVDAIVSGSLRADGDKIRITAVIISASGFQDWTNRFDGAARDVFSLQEDVATEVRNELLGETGEQLRAASRPTSSEAFDRYMRGLLFLNKRDEDSLLRAQELFQETIEIDSHFGPAYWRLAITLLLLSDYAPDRRREIFDEAIKVANRGVDADPSIREAVEVIFGFVHHQYGNWSDAAAAYDAALDGQTIYPTAFQWHSRLLSSVGLLDESLRQAITARSMDPASQVLNSRVANAYLWTNELRQAGHFFEEANNMGLGAPIHYFGYAMFLLREDRTEEARASVRRALQLFSADDSWVDPVFDALADPLDPAKLDIAYRTVEQMMAKDTAPYITMIIWALLNEPDRVMEVAMRMAESGRLFEHESAQVEIIYLDELRVLREHEEFPVLLQKLGLSDYWAGIGCRWDGDQVRCDTP